MLPFWAQIKILRTRHRETCKFINSGQIDTILGDPERYDVELPEYVKIFMVFKVRIFEPRYPISHVA